MSPTTAAPVLPMVLTEVEAVEVERLSPSFVRVTFAGAELAEMGVDGPWLDQRIKLVLPEEHGVVPSVEGVGADWYAEWRALPPADRVADAVWRDLVPGGPELGVDDILKAVGVVPAKA